MNDRKEKIVQIVNRENDISFFALKQHFPDIADITLRRDLEALSKENRIIRFHGGVRSIKFQVGTDGKLSYREVLHIEAKRAIARKAVEFIHPNTTVFIDSGSSCLELCKVFPDIPVLVFTSGINCAMELCKRKNVQIYTLGGVINKDTMALSGSTSLSCLDHLNFSIAFMGVLGCSDGTSFTAGEEECAILKREVIRRAARTFMLADSSKFGVTETFSFCHPAQLDTLITDDRADPGILSAIAQQEVNVIVAQTQITG